MDTNLRLPHHLFTSPVRYEIPDFQRRYVWKQEDQWEPLWNDVERLAESIMEDGQAEPHFLGAVVFQQERFPSGSLERRIVVDGQQRLTTLQLVIDAIQEVLEVEGYSHPAKRLSALVENPEEYRDGDPDGAFKVWPTAVDRDAFRLAMRNDQSAAQLGTSQIVRAHEFFKRQTRQWLDKFAAEPEQRDRAAKVLEVAVRTKLQLVVIDLDDSDNPHVIFETLNARGTPLLQSDMVKNKILYEVTNSTDIDKIVDLSTDKQLWPFDGDDWWAQEVGRGFQRRPRIDLFLNHWLTLRNRSETKSYDEFRLFERYSAERSKAGETIRDVARDMGNLGRIFQQIENESLQGVVRFLQRRNALNMGVTTPVLLWLLSSNIPPAIVTRCLTALESFLVRRVLCGLSARSYGDLFVKLIEKLATAPVESADKVVVSHLSGQTAQASLWPDDSELLERFVNAPLYQWLTQGRLRMVLSAIEKQLRTVKAESQEVPKVLQIEHIMPRAWHRNWPLSEEADIDGQATRRDRVIHTMGNLTLVNGHLNPLLSNSAWNDKRKTLGDHSVLFLNKHLINEAPDTWDEQAIETRAEWLHKIAVEIWPHAKDFGFA